MSLHKFIRFNMAQVTINKNKTAFVDYLKTSQNDFRQNGSTVTLYILDSQNTCRVRKDVG